MTVEKREIEEILKSTTYVVGEYEFDSEAKAEQCDLYLRDPQGFTEKYLHKWIYTEHFWYTVMFVREVRFDDESGYIDLIGKGWVLPPKNGYSAESMWHYHPNGDMAFAPEEVDLILTQEQVYAMYCEFTYQKYAREIKDIKEGCE